MKNFYYVLGAVAVVGVGVLGYTFAGGSGTAVTEPIEVEGLDDMETLVAMAQGVTKGDPNAPLTIVEFGDYQCPGCGSFALTVKPQIELGLVQTGKAKFVYYDFPLIQIHPHAFLASRAGRCAADQDQFWAYHDALFRNQPTWASQQSVEGTFIDYAEDLGLDADAFAQCVRSDRHADVISANMRLAYELGIDGTPTVMISMGRGMARRMQVLDYRSIQQVAEELLAQAQTESNQPGG